MSSTTSWSGVGLSPPGASSPTLSADSQSASTSPAVIAGLVSVCSANFCCMPRRPLRTADALRSRSRLEGGIGTISSSSSVIVRRSRFSDGTLRGGAAVAAPRARAGGALRGLTAGFFRATLRAAFLDVLTALAGACRVGFLAADRFVDFRVGLAFAAGPDGRAGRRALLAPRRTAVRRAVFADFDAVLRPLERLPGRAVVRAAFLVPRAALRLAIACSFLGPHVAAAYLDSYR